MYKTVAALLATVAASTPNGQITMSQCGDSFGVFKFDEAGSSPHSVAKGDTVKFDLKGTLTAPIEVLDVHVDVKWGKSTLYTHDFTQDNTYTTTYDYSPMSVAIPKIAPSGAYTVSIVGTGKQGGKSGNVLCVNASFSL